MQKIIVDISRCYDNSENPMLEFLEEKSGLKYTKLILGADPNFLSSLDWKFPILYSNDVGRYHYRLQYYGYGESDNWYEITDDAYVHLISKYDVGESYTFCYLYVFSSDSFELDVKVEKAIEILCKNVFEYETEMSKKITEKSSLEKLFLPGDLKERIVEHIETFMNGKHVYEKLGIPWKTGMLFYGDPGNGKTFAIRALAEHFGLRSRDIKKDISRRTGMLDTVSSEIDSYNKEIYVYEMAKHLYSSDFPTILYIEDIEKIISHQSEDDSPILTTSDLLNSIDGVNRVNDGTIFIGTTNNIKDMSAAILGRPGRFDMVVEFPPPEENQIHRYFEFYDFKIEGGHNNKYVKSLAGSSMAFVENFMKTCMSMELTSSISTSVADKVLSDTKNHLKVAKKLSNSIGFTG